MSRSLCESLALALLNALELATEADSSSAALPLLIAVHRMAADEETMISRAMRQHDSLIVLMTDWLPKATQPMAIPTAKASGLSAACTLRLLSDAGATLDGGELSGQSRLDIYIYLEPPCPQKSREVTQKSGFETWQVEKPGFCSENRVVTPGPHFPRFSTLSIMFDKISTLTQSEHLPLFRGGSRSHK